MNHELARACETLGIEPAYFGLDAQRHSVPEPTLVALVRALGVTDAAAPPPTIAEVLAEPPARGCFVPDDLADARVWGITCQLASLASARNAGIGDFADLAELCRIAASEGADFVGVNPLHALFWSDPARVSPFFPSNRRFLNPLYIALDWIDGFPALSERTQPGAAAAPASPLLDLPRVAQEKDRLLRGLFARFPWTRDTRGDFRSFCDDGGEPLFTHALFEAISEKMVGEGRGATPATWPASFARRDTTAVAAFAGEQRDAVDYHLWLQWLADRQLGEVQRRARAAGLRIGLYVDFAVGAAPDGSAAWGDPQITIPDLSIGAPPDPFSLAGQDWGLAPLSPASLAALDARPLADTFAAATRNSGAVRIDHAMGLARMWLIPRGAPAADGAYVRYPLRRILRRLAEVSHAQRTLVIGEDLGVVPEGFRELMEASNIHRYKVVLFERDAGGFATAKHWPKQALACFATHDMPTFAGWWEGTDLEVRRSLGMMSEAAFIAAQSGREEDRTALRHWLDAANREGDPSTAVHTTIASSPCRLAALQIEDALAVAHQTNIPGTVSEYPNWCRRLPVSVENLAGNATFQVHTSAMRRARPK